MAYELWETTGGNMIADFSSLEAALCVVREELQSKSKVNLRAWQLMYEDDEGETQKIAAGEALIDLARSTAA